MEKSGVLNQRGFTLIELMIVIAIIGILSSIAMNAYQDYIGRAQVSEGLSLTGPMTVSIAEFYSMRGSYPTENQSVGLASPSSIVGSYVSSVDIYGRPYITEVTFGREANDGINGNTLQLSVITDSGGIVRWKCKSPNIEDRYLPTACRN